MAAYALRRFDDISRRRTHVDELPRALLAEHRQGGTYPVEQPGDVGSHHCVPVILLQVIEWGHGHRSGIRHQNVKAPVHLHRGTDESPKIFPAGHVDEDAHGLPAVGPDVRGEFVEAILAARAENDPGASRSKVRCDGRAPFRRC